MLMPMYEFLPLVLCIGGFWWATVRGTAFSRFLVTWTVGMWLILSWDSEKMPWNNTHIALPACMLAAWISRPRLAGMAPGLGYEPVAEAVPLAESTDADIRPETDAAATPPPVAPLAVIPAPNVGRPPLPRVVLLLASIAAVAGGALAAIAFLPHSGTGYIALNLAIAAGAILMIAYAAWPQGRRALPSVLVAVTIGALGFFSVRTMVTASFVHSDDPKDMLIYTQTSPQLLQISKQIDQLASATGKGHGLAIAVDSTDSFAWPWAWYLRDYTNVTYVDFTNGAPQGDFDVMLVNASNSSRVDDQLTQAASTQFAAPIEYPHRWWFDETYKTAMDTGNGLCTDLAGKCGPFRMATWDTLADGLFHGGWFTHLVRLLARPRPPPRERLGRRLCLLPRRLRYQNGHAHRQACRRAQAWHRQGWPGRLRQHRLPARPIPLPHGRRHRRPGKPVRHR